MNIKKETWLEHEIRFVEIEGEWWGIAKDIADALCYSSTPAMTRHLKSKFLTHVKLAGMNQKFTAISEQGIYKAITRSQRPEAEAFEDWLFEVVKTLRQSSGLEGFQIFRMLDKEHQKEAMTKLRDSLQNPTRVNFIKANTIANKAVSSRHGHKKMLKKNQMSPEMLIEREPILTDAVDLMIANEKFNLGLSVSEKVYEKYVH
ncbi:BRO-N domain-containing protein [Lysinibacillus pakistanensis]|uniref:BRO family protein n=1 Tax=Lysinibacillus pakistanensis TaxID=759811 RepID=A0AAX3WY52_9BACI|nr:BRO family protein [Lysinibacillus pakistanensis]MDM5231443.1 BRO family protein [Lysinibacillus pakistanensis]WHY46990.1 BRO family protein [Lysinibacillus pakistanensis]WHY52002.1 BRO family protein [Lysinibacillus pakistanensis]